LRKQKAAAIAKIGVVGAELVAMIAQRQRGIEAGILVAGTACGQRFEPPEMAEPIIIRQAIKADLRRGAIIAKPQDRSRKIRRRDRIVKFRAKRQNRAFRAKGKQRPRAQAVG